MKNLVRGGVILLLISLFVVFIYAQTSTENALSIANDSQLQLNNTEENKTEFINTVEITNTNKAVPAKKAAIPATESNKQDEKTVSADNPAEKSNKLVEKTVSAKAVSKGKSRGSFVATAYCLRGKTAMGHNVRKGIIAADPRVLKLGSRVNLGAGAYSGQYLVSDTGGKIKGNKIDIWVASCAEARRFGRRKVTISQ